MTPLFSYKRLKDNLRYIASMSIPGASLSVNHLADSIVFYHKDIMNS